MIYPTRRAVLAAGAMAPLALLLGVLAPAYWHMGLAGIALLLALLGIDLWLSPGTQNAELVCEGPGAVSVGAAFDLSAHVRFSRGAPTHVQVAAGASDLVRAAGNYRQMVRMTEALGEAVFPFEALRRGRAAIGPIWLRWSGPLGLIWIQKKMRLDQAVTIIPDIRPVRERSAQLVHRDAAFGLAPQLQVGEGSEFEALAEYHPGLDRRSIDWKQSARHSQLLAKEYRTERNNNIIMAVDSGRAMCEPLAGMPRIDRAVSAALLTAFVALKDSDRVGFFGFDSHPRVASNAVSGSRSFALLQQVAAGIDYSSNETNFTLGMATLAERLHRRSLIVIFTEFTDTITAELMLHAVGALLKRHLLLFVVMRDEELEEVASAGPVDPTDVTRAITAAALLRQRRLVIAQLRRLGVHVLEASYKETGPVLVNAYLDLKRRSLL